MSGFLYLIVDRRGAVVGCKLVEAEALTREPTDAEVAAVSAAVDEIRFALTPEQREVPAIRGLGDARRYLLTVADRLSRMAAGAEARNSQSEVAAAFRAQARTLRSGAHPQVLRRMSVKERGKLLGKALRWDPLAWR